MKLGAFSVSLAVKDLAASRDFYTKLGFEPVGGDSEGFVIMRNGETVIGLFAGMFDENILTFNPGWDQQQNELTDFTDVRELRAHLADDGIEIDETNADDAADGPAHVVVTDPDGNTILIDQHR
jgi:lactoylglutathione lyase